MKPAAPPIKSLLFSLFGELFALEFFFKLLALKYLLDESNPILAACYFCIGFAGSVFCGPISGYLTDSLPLKKRWCIPSALGALLILAWICVAAEADHLVFVLTIIISLGAYYSSNIRIALSKYLIPKPTYSKYHVGVIWVMEIVPLVVPAVVALFLGRLKGFFPYFIVLVATFLSIGSALLYNLTRQDSLGEIHQKLNPLSIAGQLKAAWACVWGSKIFRESVYIASAVNFLILALGYLSVTKLLVLSKAGSEHLSPLILVTVGLGGITGGFVDRFIKRWALPPLRWLKMNFQLLVLLFLLFIFCQNIYSIVFINFFSGLINTLITIQVWNIRLSYATDSNIGTLSGITGSFYKVLPLLGMPIVGLLNAKTQIGFAYVFILLFLIPPLLYWAAEALYSE